MPGHSHQESGRKVQETERKARRAGQDCDISGRTRRIYGRRREMTQFAPGTRAGTIIAWMKIFFRSVVFAGLVVTACTSRAGQPGGNVPPPKPVDPPQLAPTRTSEVVKPDGVAAPNAAPPAVASNAAQPVVASNAAQPGVALASHHADGFAASVRPVLQAHCAPCHEPGGKMYDRLPFDKGETIASHREGVLKRLKGDDRAAVEQWLAGLDDVAAKP